MQLLLCRLVYSGCSAMCPSRDQVTVLVGTLYSGIASACRHCLDSCSPPAAIWYVLSRPEHCPTYVSSMCRAARLSVSFIVQHGDVRDWPLLVLSLEAFRSFAADAPKETFSHVRTFFPAHLKETVIGFVSGSTTTPTASASESSSPDIDAMHGDQRACAEGTAAVKARHEQAGAASAHADGSKPSHVAAKESPGESVIQLSSEERKLESTLQSFVREMRDASPTADNRSKLRMRAAELVKQLQAEYNI